MGFNPGPSLPSGGILIGTLGQEPGTDATKDDDVLFLGLSQGLPCLVFLEMGLMASRTLKALRRGGVPSMISGIALPILFATTGIAVVPIFR